MTDDEDSTSHSNLPRSSSSALCASDSVVLPLDSRAPLKQSWHELASTREMMTSPLLLMMRSQEVCVILQALRTGSSLSRWNFEEEQRLTE